MDAALSKQYLIAGAHVHMKTLHLISFDALYVGSLAIIMLQKVNKKVLKLGILSFID